MIIFENNTIRKVSSLDEPDSKYTVVVGNANGVLSAGYVLSKDWEFSDKYKTPPVILCRNGNNYPILDTASMDLVYFDKCKTGGYVEKKDSRILRDNDIDTTLSNEVIDEMLPSGTKYHEVILSNSFLKASSLCYNVAKYRHFNKSKTHDGSSYISKIDKLIGKELGSSTFGIEIETKRGLLPLNELNDCNFYPLRDGSISGIEYTSGILSGETGLGLVNRFLDVSKDKLDISINESLHVHIRAGDMTDEKFMNLYRTIYAVQNEIYAMFPLGMKETGLFKSSQKNYTNPLKKYGNKEFTDIYSAYGGRIDHYRGFGSNTTPHPKDESQDRKWNINTRYKLVNFIPTLFNKSNTVEFRIHPPSLDKGKLKLWILFTTVLTRFAMENKDYKTVTLLEIMNSSIKNKTLNKLMIEYINGRKDYYKDTDNVGITRSSLESGLVGNKSIKDMISKAIGQNEISNDSNQLFFNEKSFFKNNPIN